MVHAPGAKHNFSTTRLAGGSKTIISSSYSPFLLCDGYGDIHGVLGCVLVFGWGGGKFLRVGGSSAGGTMSIVVYLILILLLKTYRGGVSGGAATACSPSTPAARGSNGGRDASSDGATAIAVPRKCALIGVS